MKIVLAKSSGFCMGVRRAVELVLDAPGKSREPICTYGPLIHNPQVLDLLEEKGIGVIESVPAAGGGTVLIRAHGVPPEVKGSLRAAGFDVIDATCPRVIKVQTIIRRHARRGYAVIIVGDRDHPEVIGLLGFAGNAGHVVDCLEQLEALPPFSKAIIVAQTTQNTRVFSRVVRWAAEKFPHYETFDTICDSTAKRQAEVKSLARSVDAVVVVGGFNSGNTRRLVEIAERSGVPAFHVASEADLDPGAFAGFRTVGLTAGASTPNWIIKRVYRTLEILPIRKAQGWRRWLFSVQRALLLTNIYVSLGAACLCYASMGLLRLDQHFPHVLIAMLYVLSMHILNNLIGTKADRYNDPDRASFYTGNRVLLGSLALTAGGVGLVIAYAFGRLPFAILLLMSLMGLSYNVPLLPRALAPAGGRYRRLRDIPGSKTILIAVAWGVVTTVLPTLTSAGGVPPGVVPVFLWAVVLVFVRTAFFAVLDLQGDRIVGKGTIPIMLGEKRTLRLLRRMLAGLLALLPLCAASNLTSHLAVALTFCPLSLWCVLTAYDRGNMHPGIRLEFLVETLIVAAGPLTLVRSLLAGG